MARPMPRDPPVTTATFRDTTTRIAGFMAAIAIIGAGELGGAVAQALAARDCVARIVIVDGAAGVAAGKALDIQQSGAVDGFHTRLSGTDDLGAVTGCAACVVADQAGLPAKEWDGENGLPMVERVLRYSSYAPIVFAGAMQPALMLHAALELHAEPERLIGSAPEALVSAIKAMAALEARCSPVEVSLAVLGVPPTGFVVPWSEASVGGYALDRVLTQVQLSRLEARAAQLWPPGPHTLGAAAACVVEGIVRTSRRSYSILTLLNGEFGVRNVVGALPVFLSPRGISGTRMPLLNTRERVQVETALGS
jgi:malate dehydrogenase